MLTHWGRVTHICVGSLTIISSDNGLSPGRRQAIIWTIAGILLFGTFGTNFSQILSKIHTFSFKKISFENVVCKMAAILSRPQYVKTIYVEFRIWAQLLIKSLFYFFHILVEMVTLHSKLNNFINSIHKMGDIRFQIAVNPCILWVGFQKVFTRVIALLWSYCMCDVSSYFSVVVYLRLLYHHMLAVSYISRESWVLCFLLVPSLMMCANNRIHYDPTVLFVCFHTTLPHYHHYADLSECIELM